MKLKKLKEFFLREARLKSAFEAVHNDMRDLENNHLALKRSADEWIVYLDQENRLLKQKVQELESRLDKMSRSVEKNQLSVLERL